MKATALTYHSITAPSPRRREPPLADSVFGMLIFVATEVMFFTALISAYVIIRARVGDWAPPEGAHLPVAATALNTSILIASGILLHAAGRWFMIEGHTLCVRRLLSSAAFLGSFFVIFQGYEWINLISYGMTMTSGIFGACFFLLIGTHGLHAAIAALALICLYRRLTNNVLRRDHLRAMQIFWYFVVGIWPVLYALVYF
jgi:cytochrome c oxidase subunit III